MRKNNTPATRHKEKHDEQRLLMALENARDVYTRRSEGCSLWVVKASQIVASQPEERGEFFDPAESKVYRHPTFYRVPDGMEHM